MTEIFTGEGLGLNASSLTYLGEYGPSGKARFGQGNERIDVNAATGNLVLSHEDGYLACQDIGMRLVETYNSGSKGWVMNVGTKLYGLTGSVNGEGSVLYREDEDGHVSRYVYDKQRLLYVRADGARATLKNIDGRWCFESGSGDGVQYWYDESGRLTLKQNQAGAKTLFFYEGEMLVLIKDSAGQEIRFDRETGRIEDLSFFSKEGKVHHLHYTYDALGRLSAITQDLGEGKTYVRRYGYQGESHLITDISQSDGSFYHIEYDEQGRVLLTRDGEGRCERFSYFEGYTRVEDGRGLWFYHYDEARRLLAVEGPEGLSLRYEYQNGRLSALYSNEGVWRFEYNKFGDCVKLTAPDGQITLRRFDEGHHLLAECHLSLLSEASSTTEYSAYDTAGRKRFEVKANGVVYEWCYDAVGHCIEKRCYLDSRFDTSLFRFEAGPALTALENWASMHQKDMQERYVYRFDERGLCCVEEHLRVEKNANGQLVSRSILTEFIYDASGRLLSKTLHRDQGAVHSEYVYDSLGRLLFIKGGGVSEHFFYDDAHAALIIEDSAGLKTIEHYDRSGLLLYKERSSASQHFGVLRYRYDEAGRLIQKQDGEGGVVSYFYDGRSRLTALVKANGSVTEYQYDEASRLLLTEDYATLIAVFGFGDELKPFANYRPINAADDRKSRCVYNNEGRLWYEIDATGAVVSYCYDDQGQVLSKRSHFKRLAAGENFLPEASSADRIMSYRYDETGHCILKVDAEGYAQGYRYDARGLLLEARRYWQALQTGGTPVAAKEDIVRRYLYDEAGLLTASIDGEGYLTTYSYNQSGLLCEKKAYAKKQGAIDNLTALRALNLIEDDNDHRTTYQYNAFNQLEEERGETGLRLHYLYDQGGRVAEKTAADEVSGEQRTDYFRFDEAGRLIAHHEGGGPQDWEEYRYDNNDHLREQRNALSEGVDYFYDKAGRLIGKLDTEGRALQFAYNAFDELAAERQILAVLGKQSYEEGKLLFSNFNQKAREKHYRYDGRGRLIESRGAFGQSLLSYNAFGELAERADKQSEAKWFTTRFDYDKRGLITSKALDTAVQNRRLGFRYDAFARLKEEIDAKGLVRSRYAYDKRDNLTQFTDSQQHRKYYEYDAFSRLLTETSLGSSLVAASFVYEDKTGKLSVTHPGTGFVELRFNNAFGDSIFVCDAKGRGTHFAYDERGRLVRKTEADGSEFSFHYDRAGRLSWQMDAAGVKISYRYDCAGRVLLETKDPEGLALATRYCYDGAGSLLSIEDAAGLMTTYAYDEEGRLTEVIKDPGALHLTTRYDYDAAGHLQKEERLNPLGQDWICLYRYDNEGRVLSKTLDPKGLAITLNYSYDQNGNLATQTDALGHRRCYFYDTENRLHYELGVLGEVTEHRYDAMGHEIECITYAARLSPLEDWQDTRIALALQADFQHDRHHWFLYDSEGRVTASYDAEGFVITYLYDAAGNLLQTLRYAERVSLEALAEGAHPLPKNQSDSRKTIYSYDALNRLRFCIEGGQFTEKRYDTGGRLIGEYQYQLPSLIDLSSLLHLTEKLEVYLQQNKPIGRGHAYQYDGVGRLILQSNAPGEAISYRYDNLDRIIEQIAYAALKTTEALPEASAKDRVTRFVYDAAGRERFCIGSNHQLRERRYDACGNVLEEIAYHTSFTKFEDLSAAAEDRHQRYQYDALGRLIEQRNALELGIQYHYDANGNLLSKSNEAGSLWRYLYDENNRLISEFSPEVSVFDHQAKQQRSIETRYHYDSLGNQRTVIHDAGFKEARTDFSYDRLGQQIGLTVQGVMVDDSGLSASPSRVERLSNLCQETIYNAFGEVAAIGDSGGHWRHLIYNNLGQKTYDINPAGAVLAYQYDAYGNLIQRKIYSNPTTLAAEKHLLQESDLKITTGAADRTIFYEFDAANRLRLKREGASRYFEEGNYGVAERQSAYEYNAFGEVVCEKTRLHDHWLSAFYDYDNSGQRIAFINAEGYLTEYRYNLFGNLIAIDQFAEPVAVQNNCNYQKGRLSTLDRMLRFEVDALGRVIEKRLLNVSYSRINNQNLESQKGDLSSRYSYDALGNLVESTDSLGHSAYCFYDALGRLIAKTGAQTSTHRALTEYSYDGLGNLSQEIRRFNGALVSALGRYETSASSQDQEKSYFYTAAGQLSQTNAGGRVDYYSYDEAGRLSRNWYSLTTADGSKVLHDERFRYNKAGLLSEKIIFERDGRFIRTQSGYNVFGELISEVLGQQQKRWDYDNSGQVWRSNQDGRFQLYLYDLKGRLSQVLQASNAFSVEHKEQGVDLSNPYYDSLLRFDTGRELVDLQRTSYRYNGLDALIEEQRVSAQQYLISYQRDGFGNVLWQKDALGNETEFSYNNLDCLIEKKLPAVKVMDAHGKISEQNPIYTYAYDALGRLISSTDPAGHRRNQYYDAEGRLIEEQDAGGFSRYKRYDLLGNLSSSATSQQEEYHYDYDANNQLTAVTNARGEKKLYRYDEAGQLLSRRNLAANAGLIEESLYEYDQRGNLLSKKEAGHGALQYNYDEANRLLSRKDANGFEESWRYDGSGRLISHQDLGGVETRYQYNSNGLLLSLNSNNGKDQRYHYNADGTLRQIDDEGLKQVVDYSYDANGQVISKQSSQGRDEAINWLLETDSYSYDALGRLTEVVRTNPADSGREVLEPFSIHYDYDASGNIRHMIAKVDNGRAGKSSEEDYFTYDVNERMLINKGVLQDSEIVLSQHQGSRSCYYQDGRVAEADSYNTSGHLESFLYYYDALGRSEKVQKYLDGARGRAHTIKTMVYDEAGHAAIEFLYDNIGMQVQKNVSVYEDGLLKQLLNYDLRFSATQVVSSVEYKNYDAVGNLKGYQINAYARKKGEIGYTSFHNLSYRPADGYCLWRDELKTVYGNGQVSEGANERRYDVNGNLAAVVDSQAANTVYYLNDSETGLRSKKAGHELTGYLSVGGHHIADVHYDEKTGVQTLSVYAGFTPTGAALSGPLSTPNWKKPDFAAAVQESLDADGRTVNQPENSFASYTVQTGDNLRAIALTVYGDASLWYLIADANGLGGGEDDRLRAGLMLDIPSVNQDAHFTAATHKAYQPLFFLGDLTATAPTPKLQISPQHQPWWKKALVGLVSVVATVLAASLIAAIPAFGLAGSSGFLSAGLSLLTGANSLAATLGAFSAGFIGALASEALALNLGMIESFNLKSALAAGLATAAGAGITGFFKATEIGAGFAARISNYDLNFFSLESATESFAADSTSQLARLVLGEQKQFDWIEAATATAMAGIVNSENFKRFDRQITKVDPTGFSANEFKRYAGRSAERLAHGEHFNALDILGDTLGATLGDSLSAFAVMLSEKEDLVVEGGGGASGSENELVIQEEELKRLVNLSDEDRALIAADYAEIDSITLMNSIDRTDPNQVTTLLVFDGTWNDKDKMADKTNPALLYLAFDGDLKDSVFYTRGVGTDQGEAILGGATGYGATERVHKMYEDYVQFVNKSIKENKDAKFNLVVTGFSRGSAEAREFVNYLDEKGIPDLSSLSHGNYTHYFAPPRYTALVLFDTVASMGVPGGHFGFRLDIPKHVQAVLQITARDEQRAFFPLTSIMDKNNPYDQRLTEITLPGVHSDIGGGYHNEYSKIALDLAWRYMSKIGVPLNAKLNKPPSIYDKSLNLHDSRYSIDKIRQVVTHNHLRTIEYVHNPR